MKTPLQEVFAHLRASKESDSFGEAYCVDWLLEMEESMLEKERQELKDAFEMGVSAWASGCTFEYYYNETYKDTEQ